MDFPSDSVVKNLPATAGDSSLILGWEYPLKKEMATHSSILAWDIPWTGEPGWLQSMGSKKSWTVLSKHKAVIITFKKPQKSEG